MIAPVTSSVPPTAVICAAPLAVTAAATAPVPLIPPVALRVIPLVTVRAVAAPAKVSVSDPLIVIVLTVAFAPRVGEFAVVPMITRRRWQERRIGSSCRQYSNR
jgi:hypothetical protein